MSYRQYAGLAAVIAALAFGGWAILGIGSFLLKALSTIAALAAIVFVVLWLVSAATKRD